MQIPDFIYASVLPLLVAFIVTSIFTPVCIILLKKWHVVDDPKIHIHPALIHKRVVPRGGSIPLFIGSFVSYFVFIPINSLSISIFIASLLMLAVGVLDDVFNARSKDVPPLLRLIVIIASAILVVASGVSIHFITNPFGSGILRLDTIKLVLPFFTLTFSDALSVAWLVWVMNMLNWSKGVDGQMPGIVAISALVIGILSLRFTASSGFLDAKLSFIIAGAALGFLLYNFYPAKIFPGYGATSLYLLLGVASILSSAKLATAILVMGVPTVDAFFTIIRRVWNKRSPLLGDRKHLHHLLLRLGYNQRQIALFYWFISAILGVISLTLQSRSKIFAIIMLVAITVGALLFLHTVTRTDNEKTTS
jgi:UDP-GlcNAc:undecaprenyl-phosphate GlcNAc-1-phosphate transferase